MFKINLAKLHSIHKSILISFLALIVTLIVVYVWFYVYPKQQGEEQVVATRIGIANRLDILQIKGDSIATNPELIQSVASLDANTVQSILFSEKEKSHIPVLSVIDSKGFFISRTLDNGISGDNVFLIAPLGRAMYAGVEKKSVITPGLSDTSKLFFASGRWIYSGSTKVGALFTSDLVTDTFAVDFAKQYLAKNIKVAFYRKDSGINATNFTGEEKQSVLAFIHPNSRFIKTGFDNEYIQLPNGKRFIVRNIIFPGVETSPGGMLVFVPLGNQLHQKIIVVLPQLLFLFLALIFHSNAKKERKLHSFYYVLIATTIVLTFFAYLIYTYIGEGVIKIKDPVYPLYNSVLAFQPTVGVFDLHASQNINIVVNSGNENVNAFNTTVLYDPKLVEVSSISTKNSMCILPVT